MHWLVKTSSQDSADEAIKSTGAFFARCRHSSCDALPLTSSTRPGLPFSPNILETERWRESASTSTVFIRLSTLLDIAKLAASVLAPAPVLTPMIAIERPSCLAGTPWA